MEAPIRWLDPRQSPTIRTRLEQIQFSIYRLTAMKTRKEILEEFVAQDPNDSFSRYALALELEKENRVSDALPQLREVIARDPGLVAAYQQLGRLLAQSGADAEAREIYRQGISVATGAGDQRARSEMQLALDMLD